jgi:hypothetical protein
MRLLQYLLRIVVAPGEAVDHAEQRQHLDIVAVDAPRRLELVDGAGEVAAIARRDGLIVELLRDGVGGARGLAIDQSDGADKRRYRKQSPAVTRHRPNPV